MMDVLNDTTCRPAADGKRVKLRHAHTNALSDSAIRHAILAGNPGHHCMNRTACLLMAAFALGGAAQTRDTMMLRAGEWRIVREGAIPGTQLICYESDHPLGQMTDRGMRNCVQNRVATGERLITIDAICRMPGKVVTVHGTIRSLGADTYRADSQIRFHPPQQADNGDVRLRITARRLGPCQPGDTPG
jgi:hypothetical protein